MGWLDRLSGKLFGRAQGNAGSKQQKSHSYHEKAAARRLATYNKASVSPRSGGAHRSVNPLKHDSRTFMGVVIRSAEGCCKAAERNGGQKFLAAHAPQLPLGTCDRPQQCRCRYKHLNDRRQESRRDEDNGIPRQAYYGEDRRYRRKGRRQLA
ncbi:MAG: hypothetical protein P8L31_05355 [Pseudomonadales bacterium]|jgi:hypothetical protein|nr:hypothetical protein [Pseudomonadales bacterium]